MAWFDRYEIIKKYFSLQSSAYIAGQLQIAKHFASEKHVGPRFVADFEELIDPEEREIRERDAYEKIGYLLRKLGIL